jgi:hypothetical protein
VSSHREHSAEFQVHYLGSSADLTAVRRSMEARGVVSRARLTPSVSAIVADAGVPSNHPTLVAARELGIEVFRPAEAIDRLMAVSPRPAPPRQMPVASTPLITLTVLVLVGVLALLGLIGLIGYDSPPSQTTQVQQLVDQQR